MRNAIASPGRIAHREALEAAGAATRLVMKIPAPLRPIADQVIRSASSVPANLAEGHGRHGCDRQHQWRIPFASAKELDSHLRLLTADPSSARAALESFDRVPAMTSRLLHPEP